MGASGLSDKSPEKRERQRDRKTDKDKLRNETKRTLQTHLMCLLLITSTFLSFASLQRRSKDKSFYTKALRCNFFFFKKKKKAVRCLYGFVNRPMCQCSSKA